MPTPVEEIDLNIPSIWEDFCGLALRSWTQILNDEGALGITARASLHGAAFKFQHWPLELAFHSRNNGSTTLPLDNGEEYGHPPNCRHAPHGGPGNGVREPILDQLLYPIPIKTDEDGCPLDI